MVSECEHDWVSSGESFTAVDRIHMVRCTKCEASDPRRRESEGNFRISMIRAVVEEARRGRTEEAKVLYDLFYDRLRKQVGTIPLRDEQVTLRPCYMVSYGLDNTCDIPDAYNFARSVGLKLADILMEHDLYTPDGECEVEHEFPMMLQDSAGGYVVEVNRALTRGKPNTFGPLVIRVPHEVYEYFRQVGPQDPCTAEHIVVDAKMGRVLRHNVTDWHAYRKQLADTRGTAFLPVEHFRRDLVAEKKARA